MVYFSSDAEIDRIGRGLLDRSLPKAEWTHAAHFAAAFWLLRRSELDASYQSARSLGVDELIDPRETRNVLLVALERARSRRQAAPEPVARVAITP